MVKKSATNAVFIGLGCWTIIVWLIHSLLSFQITRLVEAFIYGMPYGLMVGLIFGLSYGGNTCIQHFCLRLVLHRNLCIPWNYARFLNYCTERMLLQRVGGRYRFIHKLLQDHFAQMSLK